ncbi:MAG: hypothetical protein BGO05_10340 [Rhizobiales bacterium 63-7]|nr:hypothetical protein [Hyphomicrobiales bacterium]OJU66231.1 MAG: hypothetical protein BGO05_10340 [Rhizobiales bacterium 63-7]
MRKADAETILGGTSDSAGNANDNGSQALHALFLALRSGDERASAALARIARQYDLAAMAFAG